MNTRADDARFARLLEERLGEETSRMLMERLPSVTAENLATKQDLAELRGELLDELGRLRGEFGDLRGEFGSLRGEFGSLRGEFGSLRGEIADRMRVQTWYMATLLMTGIGASTAITAAITG